ncbi:glutathione S-transferase [Glycocaulis alkaliphilus]|uniref:Glutathione S-transferase n=1 Tax=Glycocaulis alkaliphilus TaxID=1434191 RepID=A0A3T0EAE5_9PROT|nr:glutathione S-transferase N-terminal domain-containing protein [Glycocaulis alkaliphilus]AZU04413.1 glutathione S-transferase [Glycocaulis alkaliphilus]GGB78185.1 thiol:disulfide oxidoreductase [Glycocaulis alkaliphilus]
MSQSPIEVFYWPTPNGWKVTIALEEMGLPYVIRPVNIGTGEQFRPEFLAISPNNRMPAITDPDGPDGKPISIFESGAILQYLARKTGKFHGANAREQAEVEQWLYWQMGGLGPMAGQAHHFRSYAKKIEPDETKLEYGANRYTNEVNRLYGVMDRRLADREYLAGAYSIADMAAWPWILPEGQGQNLDDFPNLKAWVERLKQRPALRRGRDAGKELRSNLAEDSEEAKKARAILFGQKAL